MKHARWKRVVGAWPLAAALALTACGDDDDATPPGGAGRGGGGGQGGAGRGGSGGAGRGGGGQGGGAGQGGGGQGGSAGQGGGGGGPASLTCTQRDLAAGFPGQWGWDERFTVAGLAGQDGVTPKVYDFARDADGSLVAVGYFRWAGQQRLEGIARFRDGAWGPVNYDFGQLELGPSGFSAIAIGPAGQIALATFDLNSSPAAPGGAVWVSDGGTFRVAGRFAGPVRKLAWVEGALWMAGGFELADGGPRALAVWDGTAWSGAPGGEPDDFVYDLLPGIGGDVTIGGAFGQVGGIGAQRVAAWDAAKQTWAALDVPSAARVVALERDGAGVLHAGGLFTLSPGSETSASFARWTGAAWELVGGGVSIGGFTGAVSDLLFHGGAMYVAGCFGSVNGPAGAPGSVEAGTIARWDGAAWQPAAGAGVFGSAWFDFGLCGTEPNPSAVWQTSTQRLFADGAGLLLGGSLSGLGDAASQSVARLEGGAWSALGAGEHGLTGAARAVVAGGPNCDVYGLLNASHAGDSPLGSRVARFVDGWQPVGPAFAAPDGVTCSKVAVDEGGAVFLGCEDFSEFPGRGRVYKLDGGRWRELGGDIGPVFGLRVAPDGAAWAVGSAGEAGGYLARLEGDAFAVVEGGFDGFVGHVDFGPPGAGGAYDVVVGGGFTRVGATPAARVARRRGATWEALGPGLTSSVTALEVTADAVYAAAGDEGAPDRIVLGKWDGATWVELATPANGLPAPFAETVHTFYSLVAIGDRLVATGSVWPETSGQPPAGPRNAFVFDGTQWQGLAGGVGAISVDGAALARDGLWLGGNIAEVGQGAGLRSSVGVARFGPAPASP